MELLNELFKMVNGMYENVKVIDTDNLNYLKSYEELIKNSTLCLSLREQVLKNDSIVLYDENEQIEPLIVRLSNLDLFYLENNKKVIELILEIENSKSEKVLKSYRLENLPLFIIYLIKDYTFTRG